MGYALIITAALWAGVASADITGWLRRGWRGQPARQIRLPDWETRLADARNRTDSMRFRDWYFYREKFVSATKQAEADAAFAMMLAALSRQGGLSQEAWFKDMEEMYAIMPAPDALL